MLWNNYNQNFDIDPYKIYKLDFYSHIANSFSFIPRLYGYIMILKWIIVGKKRDEKEDRFDLVLGMTGITVSNFLLGISPMCVGFYYDENVSSWASKGMLAYVTVIICGIWWR